MSRVAVVLKGYPRLSETFIAQEIRELEKRGLEQIIVSLRHPTDPHLHDIHREIEAPVVYLPEYLKDDPARVRAARKWAEGKPGTAAARAVFERDLARDRSASRHRRWGQALVLAHELPGDVTRLHSHFLHTPASVTRYAAMIRGLPWSFSAHAKDIWTLEEWELSEKIASADWGATCTRFNAEFLNGLADRPGKVDLVYHGLDLSRFPANAPAPSDRNGSADKPVRILSVGRAVEKKGYDDLLKALSRLPSDFHWQFTHIGGGALSKKLKALGEKLGIADRIAWRGAQPRSEVIAAAQNADLFVLASRITKSGDRDGLPNVLMEAQLMGVAAIGTAVSAIPELILDGKTGLLTPEHDPVALAKAIEAIGRDPARRSMLAAAGRERVRQHFSTDPGIDHLARRFGLQERQQPAAE